MGISREMFVSVETENYLGCQWVYKLLNAVVRGWSEMGRWGEESHSWGKMATQGKVPTRNIVALSCVTPKVHQM